MKINWGTGIVIGMALFMGFILYFVIQIMTDNKNDFELVLDDYYSREMVYQEELDAQSNSTTLAVDIKGKRIEEGWLLTFPEDIDASKVSGVVTMYRPSNKTLDFQMPLKLSDSKFLIPADKMVTGRWNTIVTWSYDGKQYRFDERIYY